MGYELEQRASCQYLTHKYASHHGCTMNEMLMIYIGAVIVFLLFGIFISIFIGYLVLVLIGSFIAAILAGRVVLRFVGTLKKGKQEGYVVLKIRKYLSEHLGLRLPFVTRNGAWITRRRM